jgi:hypothetical protein
MTANTAAQAFWRQTISALFAGAFVEIEVKEGAWQGVVQQFDVPTADCRLTAS